MRKMTVSWQVQPSDLDDYSFRNAMREKGIVEAERLLTRILKAALEVGTVIGVCRGPAALFLNRTNISISYSIMWSS